MNISFNSVVEMTSLCVSLLLAILGFLTAAVKAIKNKKWDALRTALQNFVQQAEEAAATGAEKKSMVLAWAQDFCEKEGIEFDADKVEKCIEELIALSKKVNAKGSATTGGEGQNAKDATQNSNQDEKSN